MNTGILGGTFNPVHVAHLRLAEAAREALGLAQVCFIPACVPPLKTADLASAEDRLEMVQLATASNAGFEVLDLELRRAGPSYSVDTLEALRSQRPRDSFWFLIGSDALRDLELWQRPDELLELTSLGVVCRPGSEAPLEELLPERFRSQFHAGPRGLEHDSGNELRAIAFPALEISASEIRQRRANGHSIRYLVPGAVLEYIEKHGLYREEA